MSSSDVIDLSGLPALNPPKWVECKIKDPIKKQIAMEAVVSAYRLQEADFTQIEDYKPILRAVEHSSDVVRDVGAGLLKALAKKHSIVLEIIKKLMNSKNSKIRFNAIYYLSSSYPHDFLIDIIGKGLNDKSSSVRMIAADACAEIGLKALLPQLEILLSIEKATFLEDVKRHIGILKDGYHLHYSSSGHPWLTYKNLRGEVIDRSLNKERFEKEGLQAIVTQMMQSDH
jgi:hypothetical protein